MARRQADKRKWGEDEWFIVVMNPDCPYIKAGKCYYYKDNECDEIGFECDMMRCPIRKTLARKVVMEKKPQKPKKKKAT